MNSKKINWYEWVVNIVLDIAIFIFSIILLISIYNNIQIKLLGNDYSSFFGYSVFEVQTGSMGEAVKAGDWIIVKYTKNPKLNDIVTFKQNDDFITHRIIEAYKGTYITKGDANSSKDEPISQEQIVGKVVKILPNFGILRKTVFNPLVLITLILTLYLCTLAFRKTKEKKTRKFDVYMKAILNKIADFIKLIVKKIKTLMDKQKKEVTPKVNKQPVVKKENKPEIVKEEIKEEPTIQPMDEEDLDKTMYFRMVPVDKFEIDNTYLKIAENEVNNDTKVVSIPEEEAEDDDSLVKSKLQMLQNKKKKCKNIIEKVMVIKNEEINEIIKILTKEEKLKTNEATIIDSFMKLYIDAKYYNHCGDYNVDYNNKNVVSKIDNLIKEVANEMAVQYKGSDNKYKDKVKKYADIFMAINYFEHAFVLIDDLNVKRESYKNKILKTFKTEAIDPQYLKVAVNNIIKTQKTYQGVIRYSLNKLDTNTFKLNINQLNSKNLFGLELEHNIAFSKVYSDYIVDKTYSEGIIAEDKIVILINLLLVQIVKDMFSGEFKNKYVMHIPESLYEKDNKLEKIFSLFDDVYAKESIVIALTYDTLTKHKKLLKALKKEGYIFALAFEKAQEIKAKDQSILSILDYVFIDKKLAKSSNVIASLPENINIVYEDLTEKVGDFGGNNL